MIRLITITVLMAACVRRVPVATPAPASAVSHLSMYCFEADIKHRKGKRMAGCADTLPLCQEAFGTARRFGTMAGVLRLFPCELWVSR